MFVGLLVILAYAGHFTANGPEPTDLLFHWSLAIITVVGDAIFVIAMLLISRGLPRREVFALRRPRSWPEAIRLGLAAIVASYVVSAALVSQFGLGAREQAMPIYWDGARLAPYLANLIVLATVVPIAEETTCRGLGFWLLEPYGAPVAVVGSALAFALLHGAVVDFPWVLTLGLGAGILRWRSGSLYPSLLLHGTINAIAVFAAGVAGATGAT